MSVQKRPQVLIVEDDLALQKQIKWALDRFDTVTAHDRESALLQCRRAAAPVVTMDLGLPPDADSVSEGFALLDALLGMDPAIKVIVLSGQSDRANACRAVELGAYDFLAKPLEADLLNMTVDRALRIVTLGGQSAYLTRYVTTMGQTIWNGPCCRPADMRTTLLFPILALCAACSPV